MAETAIPSVGSEAPEFTAPLTAEDGTVEEVSLSSLRSDGAVLLVFQPTNFELETFAERHALGEYDWFTTDDRIQVVGVNHAQPQTNREFTDYLDVTYPFCSDRDQSIAESYGVTYRALEVTSQARQACFFIDSDGVVRYQWVADPTPNREASPEIHDLYQTVVDVLGQPESNSFGLA